MEFQLKPTIYSLLVCSSAEENRRTGGWIVQPFSEISVQELPVHVNLTAFAQIMAPPGTYELDLRLFNSSDPTDKAQSLPPREFTVQEGKNIDFVVQLEVGLAQTGLYLLEASIIGHHSAQSPLRVSENALRPPVREP